jgi:xanthine dehydrogenase accessory factor
MKEIQNIIVAYDKAVAEGKRTALATVVHLEGSSYRRPGARMLITEDGELTGAISGGCLEGDALQKSQMVIAQQKSRIVTYDTTDETDDTLGVGLGCNGIINILIEPLQPGSTSNQVEFLKKVVSKRQRAVLVTLFDLDAQRSAQPGTCLLLNDSDEIFGTYPDLHLNGVLMQDARLVMQSKKSAFTKYISEGINLTAFIEYIKPAISLVVIGAGNDVMPLVDMADILGWETSVFDGRTSYARPERFAKACQVIVSKPEAVLEQVAIDEQTVFALMTHNYNYDYAMLKALVQKNVVYIGVLGPKKKLERMLAGLQEEGIYLSEQQLSFIHGPAGLDIAAETAEEIALSIIAEIKAILNGKEGRPLKVKQGAIHSRNETIIEERKLP